MVLPNTRKVELEKINELLSNKRGIYFWFNKADNSLVYIGIAVGVGGLKKRIAQQHLNPKYLEYRDEKHTSKDEYQLKYAIPRLSRKNGGTKLGIDKSAFRKSIGRMLSLKPGNETVNYIQLKLRLEVFESEDIVMVKNIEKSLISTCQPKFNSANKILNKTLQPTANRGS